MSIYLNSIVINENLGKLAINNLEIPEIVAIAREGKEEFSIPFSDYSEERLKSFVKRKKFETVKVHPLFWNHSYCNQENLNTSFNIELGIKRPKVITVDLRDFFMGKILMLISFFNIIALTYTVENKKDYKDFTEKLNIDRTVFSNFLIANNYDLTLTENYLILIERIFTEDNILNFIFEEPIRMNSEQAKIVLKSIGFGGINNASYFIFNSNFDIYNKLLYTEIMIDIYEENIDSYQELLFSVKNFRPSLGYYLYTLEIPNKMANLYFRVMCKFFDSAGVQKLTVIDDREINDKIQRRYKIFKEYFNF